MFDIFGYCCYRYRPSRSIFRRVFSNYLNKINFYSGINRALILLKMNPYEALTKISIFLGAPASAFGIIFAFDKYWTVSSQDGRVGLVLLAVFAGVFLVCSVVQEFRYSRKTRYAESLPMIYTVLGSCSDGAVNAPTETNPAHITERVRDICNKLSDAFSIITGTRCAVCVKILEFGPDSIIENTSRPVTSTLCRDYVSNQKRAYRDERPHWLDLNTDFDEMFKTIDRPGGGVFFENNLSSLFNYNNTSFETCGGPPKDVRLLFARSIIRRLTWNLPYISTIGAVIFPMAPSRDDRLVGFLCVDSSSRNNFRKRYDIELLRSISGALYPIMLRWTELSGSEQPNGGEQDGESRGNGV